MWWYDQSNWEKLDRGQEEKMWVVIWSRYSSTLNRSEPWLTQLEYKWVNIGKEVAWNRTQGYWQRKMTPQYLSVHHVWYLNLLSYFWLCLLCFGLSKIIKLFWYILFCGFIICRHTLPVGDFSVILTLVLRNKSSVEVNVEVFWLWAISWNTLMLYKEVWWEHCKHGFPH